MPDSSLIQILDSCTSTNAVLASLPDAPHGTVVAAREQTAGRGQRGNSWEADPGLNLTFSILLRCPLEARRQFELSMLVSLAVVSFVDSLIDPLKSCVKWPNDIYVGNRKISGILIENSLMGNSLDRTVAGIGININQRVFRSDAPNPVSVINLTDGALLQIDPLLERVAHMLVEEVDSYMRHPDPERLHNRYRAVLWRGKGMHPFRTPDGDLFSASVVDVGLDGMLYLDNGKSYAFKEIQFVL